MSIAKSHSAQLIGLKMEPVIIEVDISNGLHSFSIVGLGDRSVAEAKDRVCAAIKNSGFISPKQKNQKVVISLAPADVKKEGPSFDLAMALAYLKAANEIRFDPEGKLFFGELSLEGDLRPVHGLLPMICQAVSHGFNSIFVPEANNREASLAKGITIYAATSLREVFGHLAGSSRLAPVKPVDAYTSSADNINLNDIKSIRGNETAKRGLEIAAAGAHNIIMCGPPGTGKTMLAQSFVSILPDLTYEQAIEVTGIHSAARTLPEETMITNPPFRAPHHTASYPSIVGGGTFPRPGEITLAHRGVLFLDEFPEFDRSVLEALRQPLEDRIITISRARGTITFPAQCILIASMNPCPCGKGKDRGCICSNNILESYRRRISGPITDRLDIWLTVDKIDYIKLSAKNSCEESSSVIKERILLARQMQRERFLRFDVNKSYNSEMSAADIENMITMDDDARSILALSAERLGLSGRSFHRIIKVARTIADLAEEQTIRKDHVLEALQYRLKAP